jgi:hypothetical protein
MSPARIDSARAQSARAAIALLLAIAPGLPARPAAAALASVSPCANAARSGAPVTNEWLAPGMGAPVMQKADDGPALELPSDLVLHAGERFEIRWSQSGPAIDELEILLSIDGGRRFALRVSPELDARSGRYLWRAPDLSSADARLRIRYHRGGREVDGAMSAPFTLIASEREAGRGPQSLADARDRSLDLALKPVTDVEPDTEAEPPPSADSGDDFAPVHEGIWWTGMRALDVPLPAGALAQGGDRICAARELPAAGPPPDAPAALRRASGAGPRLEASVPIRSTSPAPTLARMHPLRN